MNRQKDECIVKPTDLRGTIPAAFTLIESTVTPSGVIMAGYKRAGKVKTGTIGA